jgi:hypothetical protein
LLLASKSGGCLTTLEIASPLVSALVVGERYAYASPSTTYPPFPSLIRYPIAGGAPTWLLWSGVSVAGLAVDDRDIYFSARGANYRLPQ